VQPLALGQASSQHCSPHSLVLVSCRSSSPTKTLGSGGPSLTFPRLMSPISTCRGDWLLSFVYRTSSVQFRVAGLQPVLLQDRRMENVDLSSMVSAHLSFPGLCLCLCKEHQVTSAQQTPPCQSWRPVYTRDLPPVDSVPSPSPLSSNPHTAVRPELLPHFTDEETEV
jgi:hypothetical protein